MKLKNSTIRILLADNNRQHIEVIKAALTKENSNFKVDSVATRATAIKRLKEKEYQLILSELTLKDGDGQDLIHSFKKVASQIPIIVITGKGDAEQATQAIQWGADDYLFKNRESLKALPHMIEKALLKRRFSLASFTEVPVTMIHKMGAELDLLLTKSQTLAKTAANADIVDGLQDQITKLKKLAQKILPA
jgi:DNA-binding NtrC family response regulator